ncbi:hypothetical protein [Halosimplex halobium]|uniref:hypothetical protein n=1 Tax=Halosimplex halobium TaxID=3396618 RepID=UPI003F54ADA8
MSDDTGDDKPQITEEQVRQGFEAIYGVTIEEVIGVLEQRLAEDHRLRQRLNAASDGLEATGFTEEETDSMQGIREYVDERNES